MKKTLLALTALVSAFIGTQNAYAQDLNDEMVAVYRWYNPVDKQYVTIADGEYQEGQILSWGYNDKTLMFFGFRNPGDNKIAVNSWYNPVTKDQISVANDEFNDDQMMKMGYADKHLQFYALKDRGPNTVSVYRWNIERRGDWVTIQEEGNTDAYLKKGYRMKTFQYYGVPRSTDVVIYNQL